MFKLEYLARRIRECHYLTYSRFDFILVQCHTIKSEIDLTFKAQELPPKLEPLEILHHIPTFPENQMARAYWLCEPVRLHA